ncbi:MAG: hypothetical protein ABI648_17585 [Betaproteobacteria bacterium]
MLRSKLEGVRRVSLANALRTPTTHRHDYAHKYVSDLGNVPDMDVNRGAKLHIGVDPPWQGGGALLGADRRALSERPGRSVTTV